MAIRPCAVCGVTLTPFHYTTLTAHEFACYKREPAKVPEHHRKDFEATLAWEKRSEAAKRAAQKRRVKG